MTKGQSLLGCLLALGITFSGCQNGETTTTTTSSSAAAQQDVGEVLATVNGMPIGSNEFDEAYSRSVPRRGPGEAAEDSLEKKKEVLDKLIADKLLYQEALAQGLDKDPRIQKMMVNSLLRKDVYGSIKSSDISEEELKTYFDTHQDEFIVPEKVQIRRILVKVDEDTPDADAQKLANDLRTQIEGGADFKDLAIKHSEDPYARRGGDIGFVAKDGKPGLDQVVVDKAFTLEKGATSEVFKTDEGYNVIQVANKRERIERTFDQMKGAVLRKLKTEKYRQMHDQYVANLKTKATIEVKEDKLASYQPAEKTSAMGMPGAPRVQLNPAGEGAAAGVAPEAAGAGDGHEGHDHE